MKQWFAVWRHAWVDANFRIQFVLSFAALIVTLNFFTRFIDWVERRDGVTLDDPVLRMIEPRDFTWLTFGLIYIALVVAILYFSGKPKVFLLAIQSYTLMVVIRAGMMYLLPLNPADGLIVLHDPLVQFVGNGSAPRKDLFFSGHTSTMFLLALVMKRRGLRYMYLVFTALVAVCVIWQHVHYVVDVVVAPFVAYASYRIIALVNAKSLAEV